MKRKHIILLASVILLATIATIAIALSLSQTAHSPESQAKAIREAEEYQPKGMCTMALTDAVHLSSGAKYTFPNGCLPPGWVAEK